MLLDFRGYDPNEDFVLKELLRNQGFNTQGSQLYLGPKHKAEEEDGFARITVLVVYPSGWGLITEYTVTEYRNTQKLVGDTDSQYALDTAKERLLVYWRNRDNVLTPVSESIKKLDAEKVVASEFLKDFDREHDK